MGTPLGMQVAVQADSRAPAQAHPPRPAGRWPDGVLVAVVALGTALRLWGLGAQSLWYDEWLTTEAVSGGLGELARHVANREGITPPYFVVMWAWARVVGDGEMALRSFSALAGLATVVVAYALARQLGQRRCWWRPTRCSCGTRRRRGPTACWRWPGGCRSWRPRGPTGPDGAAT